MNENIVKAVTKKVPTKVVTAEHKAILPYDLQLEYERIINMKIELEKIALEIKTAESSYNHLLQRYIKDCAKH